MTGPSLSDEEAGRVRRAFALADESWNFWERHTKEFEERYGGEWVAMHGREFVAHARDPEAFDRQLQQTALRPEELLIRWVPPPDVEFVF